MDQQKRIKIKQHRRKLKIKYLKFNRIYPISAVYGILYLPDMKFHYIGCSKNIKNRWKDHRTETKGKQYNDKFHQDLRANPDKYECVVLYEYDGIIKDRHDLYEKLVPIECNFIEFYKKLGHPIATTVEGNSHTRKHTDEEKITMSISRTGSQRTEETKQKMRESAKIAQNRPETKAKRSASEKLAQNKPETKAKKRAKLAGVPRSAETIEKMKTNRKGKGKGKKWMYKPNSNEEPILVKSCDIETKRKEGYLFGRK